MSASPLLNELRGYGYQIELTGNNLKLIGTGPRPPVELMQRLKALKNEIIAELVKYRQSDPVGNPTPCPVDFGERAAILEYDGGLEREMTEQMAALELGQPVPTQNSDGEKQITIENWRSLIGSLPVPNNHNGRHIGTIALHFLTSSHIVKAIKLGWDELELFGLLDSQHPTALLRRFDAVLHKKSGTGAVTGNFKTGCPIGQTGGGTGNTQDQQRILFGLSKKNDRPPLFYRPVEASPAQRGKLIYSQPTWKCVYRAFPFTGY